MDSSFVFAKFTQPIMRDRPMGELSRNAQEGGFDSYAILFLFLSYPNKPER